MKKKSRIAGMWQTIIQMSIDLSGDHIGAYAAMAAFFLMLSLIPMLLLLLTLIQYLPVSEKDLVEAINLIFPTTISPLVQQILNDVYMSSGWTIPVSVVVAIWAASRAIMALGRGLNGIHDMLETRNYFVVRIWACIYTIAMILAIAISLLFGVFGQTLVIHLEKILPFLRTLMHKLLRLRGIFVPIIAMLMAWGLYIVLPNKRVRRLPMLPGAVFTGLTWWIMSSFFSKYLQINTGFASMYGMMTTIILMMMWMYFLMYLLLFGGEINRWLVDFGAYYHIPIIKNNYDERQKRHIEKARRKNMELLLKQSRVRKRLEPGNHHDKPKKIEEGSHER